MRCTGGSGGARTWPSRSSPAWRSSPGSGRSRSTKPGNEKNNYDPCGFYKDLEEADMSAKVCLVLSGNIISLLKKSESSILRKIFKIFRILYAKKKYIHIFVANRGLLVETK